MMLVKMNKLYVHWRHEQEEEYDNSRRLLHASLCITTAFLTKEISIGYSRRFLSQGIYVGQMCRTPASHREVLISNLGAETSYSD
jgi:hypothetical protein